MAKKSRVVVETDPSKLNMTAMIDITFLLVVFFMLVIDLTTKEFLPVDLPYAFKAREDTEDPTEKTPRFVMNLESDGKVTFKGQTWNLSSADPRAQDAALEAMRLELIALTSDPRFQQADTSSMIPVMIHGDRAAKWKYVQWVMQVCANQRIKIYKLQFAVKDPRTPEEMEAQKGGN